MTPSHVKRTLRKAAVLTFALGASSSAVALSLEIIPAAPRYQERVTARIVRPALSFGSIYGATTVMNNNIITVTYFEQPELATSSHDVSLGQLPAGTYTVELPAQSGGHRSDDAIHRSSGG